MSVFISAVTSMRSHLLNSCSGCCQTLTGTNLTSQTPEWSSVFEHGFLYQDLGAGRDPVKQFNHVGIAHLHAAV